MQAKQITQYGNVESFIAEAAITRGTILKFGTVATKVVPATANLQTGTVGVAMHDAAINASVAVARDGCIYPVKASAAIAVGARVTSNASGLGVTAAPAAGLSVEVVGTAQEAAGAANDMIGVLVNVSLMTNGGT